MATKKTTAVTKLPDEQTLQALRNEFPVDPGYDRILLPRLGFKSQDVYEGKGKEKKVVIEAGTFIEERETEELDEEGKKVWSKEEIGTEVEGVIIFQRKQLRHYDEKTGTFTSSPVYDEPDEVVPLFQNRSEVHRGTPEELKKHYEYTDDNGKNKSALEENRILYILVGGVDGELMQLNLRGSSLYSFLSYSRKVTPPAVLTHMSSEAMKKGSIEWNKMVFEVAKPLTDAEVRTVLEKIAELKGSIAAEKSFYQGQGSSTEEKEDEDF